MNKSAAEKPDKKLPPKPPKKVTERWLHNAGLYYLQRFAASKEQFRKVMMRKIDRSCAYHKDQDREQCQDMLETLISRFEELALLDDRSYARGMVTSLRRRGLSRRALYARLQAKGLTSDQISQALTEFEQNENELIGAFGERPDPEFTAALRTARRKKIGPFAKNLTDNSNEEKIKSHNKALAVMARAGFSYDIASKVLALSADELDNYDY